MVPYNYLGNTNLLSFASVTRYHTISLLSPALSAPTIVSVNTVSSTSLMVQWSMPAGPVTGYRISYTPVNIACPRLSSGRRVVEGSGAVHMLTGLQEGVEYEITVQARGEEAFGNISLSTNRLTANDGESVSLLVYALMYSACPTSYLCLVFFVILYCF